MSDVAVNFPVGTKIKGANVMVDPNDVNGYWSDFWTTWDWNNLVRPQLDDALSLGHNCIRIIGSVVCVTSGRISQATLNARVQQAVKYCVDNGMSYYLVGAVQFTGGSTENDVTAYTNSPSAFAAVINSVVAWLCGGCGTDYTSKIIGLDLFQEASGAETLDGQIADMYSRVKPSMPATIGVTFSTSDPSNTTWIANNIASLDYLDLHNYPQVLGIGSSLTPSSLNGGLHGTYSTKDIFIGEGGADRTVYTAGQCQAWITSMGALANAGSYSYQRGALLWSIRDNGNYGSFEQPNNVSNGNQTLPWLRTFGGGSIIAPVKLRLPVGGNSTWFVADPTLCGSQLANFKVYRDGSVIASGLGAPLYDDSATWRGAGRLYKYEVTAVDNSAVESAKSAPLYLPPNLPPNGGALQFGGGF